MTLTILDKVFSPRLYVIEFYNLGKSDFYFHTHGKEYLLCRLHASFDVLYEPNLPLSSPKHRTEVGRWKSFCIAFCEGTTSYSYIIIINYIIQMFKYRVTPTKLCSNHLVLIANYSFCQSFDIETSNGGNIY